MASFPFKHVLMVGTTSGIGYGMASRLVKEGVKVTAVGRRQDRLNVFVAENGKEKASEEAFDIADTKGIPNFVKRVPTDHPSIDCIFLNAGIQSEFDFSKPETVDLDEFQAEMGINFMSFVALAHGFLPFLMGKPSTGLIFTTSHFAIILAVQLTAYSASKAALNSFVLCLRQHLRNTSVRVIELSPPQWSRVSELHDKTRGKEVGRAIGMPLDKFTDEAYQGFVSGKDTVVVGGVRPGPAFHEVLEKRNGVFMWLAKMMRGEL